MAKRAPAAPAVPVRCNDDRGDLFALVRQHSRLQLATGVNSTGIGLSAPDAVGTLQAIISKLCIDASFAVIGTSARLISYGTDTYLYATFRRISISQIPSYSSSFICVILIISSISQF